jgi:hypothetical protein
MHSRYVDSRIDQLNGTYWQSMPISAAFVFLVLTNMYVLQSEDLYDDSTDRQPFENTIDSLPVVQQQGL